MFEIDNPVSRAAFLSKVGGIEEKVFIQIDGQLVKAIPEEDVDRTSAKGKASSVQFIHFNFTDDQIEKGRLLIVDKCREKWCKIKSGDYQGWIKTKDIWGLIN